MTIAVSGVASKTETETAAAKCPQLDLASVPGISMLPSASSTQIGPVSVALNTNAGSGAYQLSVRVAGVPEPLLVPFRFTDASAWTEERTAAQQSRDCAQTQVNEYTAMLGTKRERLDTSKKLIHHALQSATNSLGQPVNVANWEQTSINCNSGLQHLPHPRQTHVRQPMLDQQQKAQLSMVPGVIGFAHELLFVADDDAARLLSWLAQGSLNHLFVADWAAQARVEQLWRQWGLISRFRLTFVPLEGLHTLQTDLRNQALPHAGLLLYAAPKQCMCQCVLVHKQPETYRMCTSCGLF